MKTAILVSKHDHCLYDLLYRWQCGELAMDISAIISNHPLYDTLAHQYDIPFHYCPIQETSDQQETTILQHVQATDFLILARYMRVLSPEFLVRYQKDIINIHHSFLPSFAGANPYQQAYDYGVKIIGATAHYVNEQLDQGPIIIQKVEPVSHRDDVNRATASKTLVL